MVSPFLLALLAACDLVPDVDADSDGFPASNDCRDDDPRANPGATEACDGIDNDCDGEVDEGVGETFHVDLDRDGFGDPDQTVQACEPGAGRVQDASDCDDSDEDVHPEAEEQCDGIDNDCDGEADEAGEELQRFYADADGDGYGDGGVHRDSCASPGDAWTTTEGDCDDAREAIHPGADETCNGVDDDCDGTVDEEAADASPWYGDLDGDGYGDPDVLVAACEQPAGHVSNADDCNDGDLAVHPGSTETCDGRDEDCDGTVDEEAQDTSLWYADLDGDGWGDPLAPLSACDAPLGYADNALDCDDAVFSEQPEPTWYADLDGDGFGDPSATVQGCEAPSGYVATGDDCDDAVFDLENGSLWYADLDGDGFGDPSVSVQACVAPPAHIADDQDCDDTDGLVHPDADETCNGVDDDCDGSTDEDAVDALLWYTDADQDGFGDPNLSTRSCQQPPDTAASAGDCDDAQQDVHPEADELCNDLDDDCDGQVDEQAIDALTWYADTDGDGYGDPSASVRSCVAPLDHVNDDTDCDDLDPSLNPDTVWYYDADLDGFGDAANSRSQCTDPGTYYALQPGDCGPSDADSHPGAEERCLSGTAAEGRDNDCDGQIDEGCPSIHCGTISSDETWGPDPDGHLLTCNVYVQGSGSPQLTLLPGTEIEVEPNAGLWVGWSGEGDLISAGTEEAPVRFSSSREAPAPGDWYGVVLGSRTHASSLTHTEVAHAGASASYPGGIYVTSADVRLEGVEIRQSGHHGLYANDSELEVIDSRFVDNTEHGLYCATQSCLLPEPDSFSGNELTGNGAPARLFATDVAALAADNTFSGNAVDELLVYSGTLTEDATWHAQDVPYRVDNSLYVQGPAAPTLTLEDGVELVFDTSTGLFVGNSQTGELVVQGDGVGVSMQSGRSSPSAGDWYGLVVGYYSDQSAITGLDIRHGGQSASYPGNISVYGSLQLDGSSVQASERHGVYASSSATVEVTDSEVSGNDDVGLYLENTATLTGPLLGNTFQGNDWPVRLSSREAHLVDPSSSYAGNSNDYVELTYVGWLEQDVLWRALDVPYYASGHVYVGSTSGSTLTLEDGVEIAFGSQQGFWVGYSGRYGDLIIDGDRTDGEGVVLRPYIDNGAGTWIGLVLERGTSSLTDLRGFTLRGAGYASSWTGGLHLAYAQARLSDCLIEDNERYGIYALSSSSSVHSELSVSDCTIRGTTTSNSSSLPDGDGLYLSNNENHELSLTNVELTDNDRYPLSLHANTMVSVDPASTYTGNGDDRIYVHGGYARRSGTWADPGVPWLIGDHVYVHNVASNPALIEIPGGTFQMGLGKGLVVGYGDYGDLLVDGATFTSVRATPQPGDWCGLGFDQYTSGSSLTNSVVEYGGKTSGCPYSSTWYGNIHTYRSDLTISDSLIRYSGSTGVDLSYSPSATVQGNTVEHNTSYGVQCRNSSGALVSGNTFSGNGSGNTSGCL